MIVRMDIRRDDLRSAAVHALLGEHLTQMYATSPAESVHALDLAALRSPAISFWTAWEGPDLLGCGALKALAAGHAEIKSMRTAAAHRRRGVAAALLDHLLQVAREHGCTRVSLETGSQAAFAAARQLYARFGFACCPPFADYVDDPHSVFMTREL